MKTATLTDLRNRFRLISSWLEHGETVRIFKRGRAFAQLTALPAENTPSVNPKPDIMAQLHEVWGNRRFSMSEVESMREAELEGEV